MPHGSLFYEVLAVIFATDGLIEDPGTDGGVPEADGIRLLAVDIFDGV